MLLGKIVRRRGMATLSNIQASSPFAVFDRTAKRIQRDRAALKDGGESSRTVDYLRNEVAERMIERLLVCKSLQGPTTNVLMSVGYQTDI
jgi:NADH dehydrogenase [ubiquinone] 1 alpha subcomplex assembly factor 5